jgi:hypothetical protein
VKTILRILPVCLALGLCGCGAGYSFSPYVGPQQNWTTGPGGYVRTVDHASIYSPGQYPPQPYIVLGAVSTDSEQNLAKAVREQHADAAIISTEQTSRTGSVSIAVPTAAPVPLGGGRWGVIAGPGVVYNQPLTSTKITANLIKFK